MAGRPKKPIEEKYIHLGFTVSPDIFEQFCQASNEMECTKSHLFRLVWERFVCGSHAPRINT